jgi:hypothetical protein
MIHCLKCWPEYYNRVVSGLKRFEVRKNDRGFSEGDFLVLQEWDPITRKYTGEMQSFEVDYILYNHEGITPGFVVMSIKKFSEELGNKENDY